MANWCSNTVGFKGTPEAIDQIKWLFQAMATKEQQEQKGQLPDWVNQHNGGYFFDLYSDKDNTEVFQYQTKWSPNIEIVQKIAEHYKLDFVQDYEEMGNLVLEKQHITTEHFKTSISKMTILSSTSITKKPTNITLREKSTKAIVIFWKLY